MQLLGRIRFIFENDPMKLYQNVPEGGSIKIETI